MPTTDPPSASGPSPKTPDRDLKLSIRQLEYELDQARGDILERDGLLARSKAAIEALQDELMQARRQREEEDHVSISPRPLVQGTLDSTPLVHSSCRLSVTLSVTLSV